MWRAWVEGVLTGEKKGVMPSLYRVLMWVPSYGYAAALYVRHVLYDWGGLKVHVPAIPVVSIGNLVCGGVGKTPFVRLLAQRLSQEGVRVGIVSRGYGGVVKDVLRVHPQKTPAQICGDEPRMLAQMLPHVPCFVGRDRVKGVAAAAAAGVELVLLDDGMQHRRLERMYEVVLVDASMPLGTGYLPRGTLRDLPCRLAKADLIVSMGGILPQEGPWVEGRSVCCGVYDLTGKACPLPQKVAVICGIGNPQRFVRTVEALGCHVVYHKFLGDHKPLTYQCVQDVMQKALENGAQRVLCTEKDVVKGMENMPQLLPLGVVKIEVEISDRQGYFSNFVYRILEKCGKKGKI